jgi:hypothetical protein
MSGFLADLMLPRVASASRQHVERVEPVARFTGAMISNRDLLILTIERQDDTLLLCESASAHLVLKGREQAELLQLQRETQGFLRDAGITRIMLRGAPGSGEYRGSPLGYKIEAVLQLLKGVRLDIVHSNSVNAWIRQFGKNAPATIRGLRQAESSLHRQAIAAACLAEAQSRLGELWMEEVE